MRVRKGLAMSNTGNKSELEIIQEEIRYRVEQEYQKYHNEVGFKYSGKDFWIQQIVDKLSATLSEYFAQQVKEAKEELRKKFGIDANKTYDVTIGNGVIVARESDQKLSQIRRKHNG
jgi:CRISPR/Cas system-associated protein Cas10 (large subunit of type III CRISPR-Cas system)